MRTKSWDFKCFSNWLADERWKTTETRLIKFGTLRFKMSLLNQQAKKFALGRKLRSSMKNI